MTLLDCLEASFRALRANVMRSVLTMLGVIIGVGAVITMVAVGAGASHEVAERIKSLGTNIMVVVSGHARSGGARLARGSVFTLSEDDAEAMMREVPAVQAAAPSVRGSVQAVSGNLNAATTAFGVTPEYFEVRDWSLARGRAFTPRDLRGAAKVALIGDTIAETLFPGQDPLGQTIRVKKVPFEVAGVLSPKGEDMRGNDQDDVILIPLSTAKKRVLGGQRTRGRAVPVIYVKVRDADLMTVAEQDLKALLRQRHRLQSGDDDDFSVRNLTEILSAREDSARIMTWLLGAVASVSLLVGGIGIMNIMLVSVTERTREIGLRMAVGARTGDILRQFLIEAVTLSSLGGAIGIALGAAGAALIARVADWPILIAPDAILTAFAFAAAVGVFFGLYPARRAARLDPIEALRHE